MPLGDEEGGEGTRGGEREVSDTGDVRRRGGVGEIGEGKAQRGGGGGSRERRSVI